jgi:hypothetical protein
VEECRPCNPIQDKNPLGRPVAKPDDRVGRGETRELNRMGKDQLADQVAGERGAEAALAPSPVSASQASSGNTMCCNAVAGNFVPISD